ncbi:hypothetical protein [Streptomyces platensis]|uniref:hypothetical protein n=1 Tax=Streptomyces platensis TaxID=58346 RepID=UPI001F2775D8|nr:hypothetical protein [Streptomyces platensis]MCF3142232.1 hypothetical protein [Streptomyces platensis]
MTSPLSTLLTAAARAEASRPRTAGNARSVRGILAAGFVPVGAEVLMVPPGSRD